jgi:acetylornithine deacetylase/succinyl-diaminopimelate desuccinylase family protein
MDGRAELLQIIEESQQQTIAFCQDFVRAPSENPPGDTRRAVDFLARYLYREQVPYTIHAPQALMPNLVAVVKGARGPGRRLVYNGHIDTYPAGDASRWSMDPFSGAVVDGKLFGRGVSDMKAGCTASVMSLLFLSRLRHLFKGEVVLTLVSDEETGGRWGSLWLLENVPEVRGDAMLNGEPSSTEQISFAEKGRIFLMVTAKGRGAHGAYVHMGDNAIKKMFLFLLDLEGIVKTEVPRINDLNRLLESGRDVVDRMKGPGATDCLVNLTYNIGTIQGGLKVNMVPEGCQAEVDIRLPQGVPTRMLLDEVDRCVARHPGISYRITQAMEPNFTPPDHEICALLHQHAEFAKGGRVILNSGIGGSDAKHFRRKGVPSAIYGPTSYNMAGTDEYVLVRELLIATKAHALASLDYLQR